MTRRGGRAPSQRQLRVGEEVRHALAWMLERGELRDPGLGELPLTITEVRVSPDLKNATVFVTQLGGASEGAGAEAVIEALTRARPFLRRRLAAAVKLRHFPDMVFQIDDSFARAKRIDALLRDPAVARDLDRSPRPDGADESDEDHGA